MNIKVNAKALKAAQLFASKKDVRRYLTGVCLRKAGFIDATNGHIAIRIKDDRLAELDNDLIIAINGTIPPKADIAKLTFDGTRGYMTFEDYQGAKITKDNNEIGCFFSLIIETGEDFKFPEFDQITNFMGAVSIDTIGINPEYLALIAKANKIFSTYGVTMRFQGKHNAIFVEPGGKLDVELTYIIMPVRLHESEAA